MVGESGGGNSRCHAEIQRVAIYALAPTRINYGAMLGDRPRPGFENPAENGASRTLPRQTGIAYPGESAGTHHWKLAGHKLFIPIMIDNGLEYGGRAAGVVVIVSKAEAFINGR